MSGVLIGQKFTGMVVFLCVSVAGMLHQQASLAQDAPAAALQAFCFDCHDSATREGGFDLEAFIADPAQDGTIPFENVITGKMPPHDAEQPSDIQRDSLLKWLAARGTETADSIAGKKSRFEFNHALNDLLGIELDIADELPEDRGPHTYDTHLDIPLTRQSLSAYFSATDRLLEFALPPAGFAPQWTWVTSRLKNSLAAYNQYTRETEEGILFSWTRENNGNSYSFFYDTFEPPVPGWYELTFEAAKIGDFPGDASLQVHAGKYYFADDRPQPQRLLDVISISDDQVQPYTIRGFFVPGESVSVHCYSPHTWRQANPQQGILIKQLTVTGPLIQWPPKSYQQLFGEIPLEIPDRPSLEVTKQKSQLARIGGTVTVSSEQQGMEKEQMLDGSNRTFWHTQFSPTLSPAPHFVIFQHPGEVEVQGLRYTTWTGGNGNGQVKAYEVYMSEDGENWGEPVVAGELVTMVAAEQFITFPKPTRMPWIKFLIKDSYSIDGRSLASIGQLDVLLASEIKVTPVRIGVEEPTPEKLTDVVRAFAHRAFAMPLTPNDLEPFNRVALQAWEEEGDFVEAVRASIKAMLTSPRFLWRFHPQRPSEYQIASDLARVLWLSVPDDELLHQAQLGGWDEPSLREQVDRMLTDQKSERWVHSFCQQWLNLRTFHQVSPSLKLYPLYDDLLDHYLPLETEAYIQHLLNEDLPVSLLIDSDFSILNQRLAQHYGVPGVTGQALRKVGWPEDSSRGGLLTMGSVLKVTTDGLQTSPILRGAWISKNLVGNTLSPPPESVKAIEPDATGATSLRELIERHQSEEACLSCHKNIDPYGFALESFDATGQWRSQYKNLVPHPGTFQYRREGYFTMGQGVDPSGVLDAMAFRGIVDLKKILLADHKKVSYNLMKQYFEFATGRTPTLTQRYALYQRIPDDPQALGFRELVKRVLVFAWLEENSQVQ
jgi:hypothetical protein